MVEALLTTKKALVEAVSGPQTVRRLYGVEVPMPMVPVETVESVPLIPVYRHSGTSGARFRGAWRRAGHGIDHTRAR